jgi:hypothetical protein
LIDSSKTSSHRAGRVAAVVVIAVILTAVTAALGLRMAAQSGRLAAPPMFDDVVYFVAAVQWLNQLSSHRIAQNIYGLLHQHSPVTVLIAAIGLALRPDDYAGPYAINAVFIFAFLLGVAGLLWRRPLVDIATCMIAAATVPMLWQTMTEARPDLLWGLAGGLALGVVLYKPLLPRNYWTVFGVGVLCGLASAMKPTAAPASFACLGLAAAVRLICDCLESGIRPFRATLNKTALPIFLFFSGLVAGALPILGVELVATIHYILQVMIYDHDVWAVNESFGTSLLRYSTGNEGRVALSYWLWIGLALAAIRVCLAAVVDRRDIAAAVSVLAAGLIAYAIPSLSYVKTYFLGAIFYGAFIVTMLLNYGAVVAGFDSIISRWTLKPALQSRISWGLHLLPLAMVLALFAANCLGRVQLATGFNPDEIQDMRAATAKVWSLLQDKSLLQGERLPSQASKALAISFTSPYPVTPSAIELYAEQARMPIEVRGEYYRRTADEVEKALLAADLAVITSSIPHSLPGPRMGDELIGRMNANPGMCLVVALPLLSTREIRVYRHANPGCNGSTPDSH